MEDSTLDRPNLARKSDSLQKGQASKLKELLNALDSRVEARNLPLLATVETATTIEMGLPDLIISAKAGVVVEASTTQVISSRLIECVGAGVPIATGRGSDVPRHVRNRWRKICLFASLSGRTR